MRPGTRITQIIPADGWRAVYADTDEHGAITLFAEPLVAWALLTEPDEDEYPDSVEPMGDQGGYVDIIESSTSPGYLGPLAPGADIETYRTEAEEHVARQRRKQAKSGAAA